MEKISLGIFKDHLIGSTYELFKFNAKELATYLKDLYQKKNINYYEANSHTSGRPLYGKAEEEYNNTLKNPPQEIYEYQNFFLIENDNQEYILLDGFRRLLYYNAPDTPILVRVYRENELTHQEILSLLVYLNHFKMMGTSGGLYYDRGFALLLKTVFNLNIHQYAKTFDAYLTEVKSTNSYSSSLDKLTAEGENKLIKERIINVHFVNDLQFIEELNNDKGYMINSFFGVLLNEERQKSNKPFHIGDFKKYHAENKVLPKLIERYQKVGTTNNMDSIKVVNQIIEEYRAIFIKMTGGTVEKTYAEILDECKQINAILKKDKSLTKLTGAKKYWSIEKPIIKRFKNNQEIKFKAVIYPYFKDTGYSGDMTRKSLPIGLFENIKVLSMKPPRVSYGIEELIVGYINEQGEKVTITHNYDSYGYTTKYFEITTGSGNTYCRQKIDLYVELSKDEIE